MRKRRTAAALTEAVISAAGREAVAAEAKRAGWDGVSEMPHSFWREIAERVEKSKDEWRLAVAERYWLDETDPAELRRRADDLLADGHWGLSAQLQERADKLERAETVDD